MKTENEYNDILSMVTHDLKSPLSAVMGALEMLSYDDLTKSEKKESITIARKATKNILKLVEDILVMAKHEAGKEHVNLKKANNLNDCFEDIIKTFKYQMKIKNINFKTDIPKDLPVVYWDIDKIQYHVLNNIISNAIKFTSANGHILMSVENRKNSEIIIKIKDDGIGIPMHKRKNVFEKYETFEKVKVLKGSGLGLYNAYYFTCQHQGSVKIIDGINNNGVGFKIRLPIRAY